MISPHGHRPTLLLPDGRNTLYTKNWLSQCAKQMAGFTGEEASDVAAALSFYLQNEHQSSVIRLEEVEALLKLCSLELGKEEAPLSQPTSKNTPTSVLAPPDHVYLSDLAHEVAEGFVMGFYELLQNKLIQLSDSPTQTVHLWGLNDCINHLSAHNKETDEAQRLEKELTSMIKSSLGHNAHGEPISIIFETS